MTPSYLSGAKRVQSKDNVESIQPSYLKGAKPIGIEQKKIKKNLSDDFKEFFTSEEETPFEQGLGTAIRGASSVGLGLPGNLMQLSKSAGKGLYNFVQPLLGLPESIEEESKGLPTTSDIEKGFDVLTEDKYKPSEEIKPYYEAAQDIFSMFMPGSGPLKAWQRIGIPIAGQLTKEGIKLIGGSEKSQEFGKIGMNLALSVSSIANGERYASNLLQQSESLLPAGKLIDAKPTESLVNNLKKTTWFRGADVPSTRPAKQLIKAIEDNISNGQIEGQMAMQLRKDANEIQKNLGAFDIFNKSDKKKAILHLNEAKDSIMKSLDHYGKTQDPTFWKLNQEANAAYGTVAKSRVIKNFIEKNAPSLKSNAAKNLFGGGALTGLGTLAIKAPLIGAVGAAGTAGLAGTLKTTQILYRIMQDPKLRKYYTNSLEYAIKENSKAMSANIQKLDEELLKEENQ